MGRQIEHILVADGDGGVRDTVAQVLRDDGFVVTGAAGSDEALSCYETEPIDLVICDIALADSHGRSLVEQIRAINADSQVIVMASHASMDSALDAIRVGAYDYLVKPFDTPELISAAARRALESVAMQKERQLLIASLTKNNRELERLNKFFRDMAIRDGLTGLYNHRYFNEALGQEVERARRYRRCLTVLFIDVDHFKAYNDTHGHQRGDDLLRALATLLTDNTRESDIVARWGGEEFVLMAPETDSAGGRSIAEHLRNAIADHPFHDGDTQPGGAVTVSIGVATIVDGNGTAQDVIFRADNAVYDAKRAGRNAVRVAD